MKPQKNIFKIYLKSGKKAQKKQPTGPKKGKRYSKI